MTLSTSTRQSGVLLHPTCIPSPYGVGDLGAEARRFLDWLAAAQQQLWQVLPLNPTTHGNSPYTSPSAFAGNPLLLSLDQLRADGLLSEGDLRDVPRTPGSQVDFGAVTEHRQVVLGRAHQAFRAGAGSALRDAYERFCQEERGWLDGYALFTALKQQHAGKSWTQWDADIAAHDAAAVARWERELAVEVDRERFLQFLFARQWAALRQYAHQKGIRIIGDMPIFVAFDSADVWAHRHLFKLDHKGERKVVAGVPPDYFSEDGQLWGNPLYNWEAMAADGYAWWAARVRAVARTVDVIRIDHFRGFAAAWEVPAGEKTAKNGRWVKGPGRAVFDAVNRALGPVPFIAEDLGIITEDVEELRDGLNLPGMKILQFAFGEDPDNLYLPHNHVERCVVYTGTHDNDTTQGWFRSLDAKTRTHVQEYLARDGHDIAWDLIRAAWSSVASVAIAPLVDVLNLGGEARFNTPGVAAGNWAWRYRAEDLADHVAARLAHVTRLYGRAHQPPKPKKV
jgi:4-alpha-glucanotransferase